MGPHLNLLFVLQLFYTTTLSNTINDKLADYSLLSAWEVSNENDAFPNGEYISTAVNDMPDFDDYDIPLVVNSDDKIELKFRQPIESANIDYSRNAVILKLQKNNAKSIMDLEEPTENGDKKSDKRSYEQFSLANSVEADTLDKNKKTRSELAQQQPARDPRGDNFMRFGRSDVKNDFMRFGRAPSQDFMRFGRASGTDNFMRFGRAAGQDFMRFGRAAGQDFMRFGRASNQDFMRFGRTPGQDFMRFGRNPSQDFMRFGRTPSQDVTHSARTGQDNFMRFGRTPHDDFMRFGRDSPKMPRSTNFMRYSRPDNFMRFGRTPQLSDNFMRFGRSMENSKDKNDSKPVVVKNELKQAVKMIHESDKNGDNENPVDKAIKVLYDKHQRQDLNGKAHSDEFSSQSSHQHNGSNDLDSADAELF